MARAAVPAPILFALRLTDRTGIDIKFGFNGHVAFDSEKEFKRNPFARHIAKPADANPF
jgi:hypothetical protein